MLESGSQKRKNKIIGENRVIKYIEDKWNTTEEEYRVTRRLADLNEMPQSRVDYLRGYLDGLSNMRQDIIEGVIWKGGEIK